jgi:hypothetical protein
MFAKIGPERKWNKNTNVYSYTNIPRKIREYFNISLRAHTLCSEKRLPKICESISVNDKIV